MNEENEKEHRIQAGLDEGEARARRYHEGNIIAAREAEATHEIDADDDELTASDYEAAAEEKLEAQEREPRQIVRALEAAERVITDLKAKLRTIKIPPFWRVEEWEQHSLGDYIAKVTYFGNEGDATEYAQELAQDAVATQQGEEGDTITVTNREGATVYSVLLKFNDEGQLVISR